MDTMILMVLGLTLVSFVWWKVRGRERVQDKRTNSDGGGYLPAAAADTSSDCGSSDGGGCGGGGD